MKQGLLALLMIGCVYSTAMADDDIRYTTGLHVNGEVAVHMDYHPTPYAEGKTFEAMRTGEMEDRYVENFNSGGRFGKAAHLKTAMDLHFGGLHVPKGEYDAGLNVDTDGNFTFVVWMGEGDDAKAHSTPLELSKHPEANFPSLSMNLMPAGEDEGSHLLIVYGSYFAMLPVSEGGAAKPGSDSAKKK